MKPSIPETGTVISLKDDTAVILLKGGGSCKGCGAGKIGLCRPGGDSMVLHADNTIGARTGDTVVVGIGRNVRVMGYLFAYIIPLVSFIAGTVIGHIAGAHLGLPSVEVPAGFLSLTAVSFYTFHRLKRLDRTSMMRIKRVVSDFIFEIDSKSDEERRFEGHLLPHDSTQRS